jgi:hypothetical protein
MHQRFTQNKLIQFYNYDVGAYAFRGSFSQSKTQRAVVVAQLMHQERKEKNIFDGFFAGA